MALEVYINDEKIELKRQVNIGLTYQIGSILNINARAGNLSNKFTVPKTKINTRILGHISNVNTGTDIPYKRNTGSIVQNGIELFKDGLAIVESSGSDFSLTIYSGNVSFFDLIKEKNVNELDWSDSNHPYNVSTVISSFTDNSNYIYPIIEWGSFNPLLNNTDTQNTDALLPVAKMSAVLKKIAQGVGYDLQGDFTSTDQFSRLILTPNQFAYTDEALEDTNGIVSNPTAIDDDLDGALSPGITYDYDIEYNDFFWEDYDQINQEFIPDNNYIGNFELDASGIFTFLQNPTTLRITINILKNGGSIFSDTILFTGAQPPAESWSLNINEFNVFVEKGAIYTAQVSVIVTTSNVTLPTINFQMDQSFFKFRAVKDIPYGADIDFATIYDWNQVDVFKDVLKQYSLTVQTDETTRRVFINPLDNILKNLDKAVDWSDKIDLNRTPTTKFRLSGYGQRNYFNYDTDDIVPVDFGEGFFDINDTTLEDEKDIVKLTCISAFAGLKVENEITPTLPFMNTISDPFTEQKARHLLLDPTNKTVNFENTVNADTGSTSVGIPFCYFNKQGKSDQLGFEFLLKSNYLAIQSMTDRTKFITASFILQEVDVYNIDFTIPVYLNVHTSDFQAEGFYYINKISNFKNNNPTKVDLIRL